MSLKSFPWYALTLVTIILGAAAIGVPVSALLVPLLVLACPLMMLLMRGGDRGRGCDHQSGPDERRDG
ncbi:DUF2933 domain-containing protein [Mycobacterium sp. MMS18-G62]